MGVSPGPDHGLQAQSTSRSEATRIGFNMGNAAWEAGETLHVKATESLSTVREERENDARITEVVFEEGVYTGSLHVSEPRSVRKFALPGSSGVSVVVSEQPA